MVESLHVLNVYDMIALRVNGRSAVILLDTCLFRTTSYSKTMASGDFGNRKKLVLFDVDNTLTPARLVCRCSSRSRYN